MGTIGYIRIPTNHTDDLNTLDGEFARREGGMDERSRRVYLRPAREGTWQKRYKIVIIFISVFLWYWVYFAKFAINARNAQHPAQKCAISVISTKIAIFSEFCEIDLFPYSSSLALLSIKKN